MNEPTLRDLIKIQNDLLSGILGALREQSAMMQADGQDVVESKEWEDNLGAKAFADECLTANPERQISSEQMTKVWTNWRKEKGLPIYGRGDNRVGHLPHLLKPLGVVSVRGTSPDGTSRPRVYPGVTFTRRGRELL